MDMHPGANACDGLQRSICPEQFVDKLQELISAGRSGTDFTACWASTLGNDCIHPHLVEEVEVVHTDIATITPTFNLTLHTQEPAAAVDHELSAHMEHGLPLNKEQGSLLETLISVAAIHMMNTFVITVAGLHHLTSAV